MEFSIPIHAALATLMLIGLCLIFVCCVLSLLHQQHVQKQQGQNRIRDLQMSKERPWVRLDRESFSQLDAGDKAEYMRGLKEACAGKEEEYTILQAFYEKQLTDT